MATQELEKCLNCRCEVRTMDNTLLFLGRIRSVAPFEEMMELVTTDAGEPLPLVFYNTPVKLNVAASDGTQLSLGGNTYISNADFWRVADITLFNNFEKRSFFRVRCSQTATLAIPGDEEAEQPIKLTSIRLFDISLGGIGFLCNEELSVGDELEVFDLTLAPGQDPFSFPIVIQRRGNLRVEGQEYGASMGEVSMQETDRLCSILFHLQRSELQRNKT